MCSHAAAHVLKMIFEHILKCSVYASSSCDFREPLRCQILAYAPQKTAGAFIAGPVKKKLKIWLT